jgi:Protein of unknown function (DUF3667)
MNRICKNCSTHFKGNFCPQCGQKFQTERFTFKHIFSEVIHAFTHADKGFVSLFKKMMYMPGTIAYEYIVEGKRKKYFNLFTFFVLITTISAFIESKELALKEVLFNERNDYGYIFNLYTKGLLFFTVPVLAFLLWLIYQPKTKLLYSEYTVFAMILMCLKAMFDTAAGIINYTSTKLSGKPVDVDDHLIFALLLVLIMGAATYWFHKKTGIKSWFRGLLTGLTFTLLQVGIYVFIVWAVFNGFQGIGIIDLFGFRFGD